MPTNLKHTDLANLSVKELKDMVYTYRMLYNSERRKVRSIDSISSWSNALCFQWVLFPYVCRRVKKVYNISVAQVMVIAYVYVETKIKGNSYCKVIDCLRWIDKYKRVRYIKEEVSELIDSKYLMSVGSSDSRVEGLKDRRGIRVVLGIKSNSVIRLFGVEYKKALKDVKNKYIDINDIEKDEE